jgi:ceramide glucosyltransferase
MGLFFWAASYTSSKIHWRGRIFQLLPGGRMRAVNGS